MLSNKHGTPNRILIKSICGRGDPNIPYGSRGDPPLSVGTRGDPSGWLYDKSKVPKFPVLNRLKCLLIISKLSGLEKLARGVVYPNLLTLSGLRR